MTRLSLLPFCLLALATPALAQDTSSAAPADQSGPPVASAEAFKLFVEACADISSGDPAAYDRAKEAGWTPNETEDTGPYDKVYSGYRDLNGIGEVDLWGAVYNFPSQRLGYCRVDFSDENNILNFNDLAGQKGLIGSISPGQNPNDVYGSWESPDKKMLVIGDRTDGVVELEFNLLLGDKPKS